MFTGLVEQIGTVTEVIATPSGKELRIGCGYTDMEVGESISVNGVCLTVLERGDGWFTVAAMTSTIGRTSIVQWQKGRRVNLERAMRADARFGGHIVQGHVDGAGRVIDVTRVADSTLLDVAVEAELLKTIVLHGSVTLDGVSLTVNRLEGDMLQVSLIDYTLEHTSLGSLQSGESVNVETDVIGKYVQRLVAPYQNG